MYSNKTNNVSPLHRDMHLSDSAMKQLNEDLHFFTRALQKSTSSSFRSETPVSSLRSSSMSLTRTGTDTSSSTSFWRPYPSLPVDPCRKSSSVSLTRMLCFTLNHRPLRLFYLTELNWTYFIVYTNTKGLDTSSHNLVNPLQNNKFYGYATVNNISMCMMIS